MKTVSCFDKANNNSDERYQSYLNKYIYKVRFLNPSNIDDTLLLLRGHLAIEYFINTIFNLKLIRGKKDLTEGLNFDKKLRLVNSMDLINSDVYASIKSLNKLRNKIAHEFEYRVSNEDLLLVIKPLSKVVKKELTDNQGSNTELLRNILSTLLINLVHSAYELDKSFGESG